jgi:hypothetical protein
MSVRKDVLRGKSDPQTEDSGDQQGGRWRRGKHDT